MSGGADMNESHNAEAGTQEFRVSIPVVSWVTLTVEAKDEDEAIDTAITNMPSVCAQCSGWGQSFSRDEADILFGPIDLQPDVWQNESEASPFGGFGVSNLEGTNQ